MNNQTELKFIDITSEIYRKYEYTDGGQIIIDKPTHLNISKSGGHRILDEKGISHYIQSGWIHLSWETHPGKPNFVK